MILRYLTIVMIFCFALSVQASNRYDVYPPFTYDWKKFFSPEKKRLNKDIKKTQQNAFDFLTKYDNKKYRIKKSYVKVLKQNFLATYYAPWNTPFKLFSKKEALIAEEAVINRFLANPGWSENRYPHSVSWVKTLKNNMNLVAYPNYLRAAIVVRPTNLRLLPTDKPSYENRHIAGQGYPFDNLQDSLLRANVPVYILHVSKDGIWYLVITPNQTIGWVKRSNIGLVNKEFQKQWATGTYITPVRDGKPVKNHQRFSYFLTRIGEIYPLVKTQLQHYIIHIAVRDEKGNAKIAQAKVAKSVAKIWPIDPTSYNIANLANQFLGIPYGWGDLYGYRDCSTTTRDLFAAFAIWMPRNSTAQALYFSGVDFQGLSRTNKIKVIEKNGIPFFSLIWMPGHIMMYIGVKDHTPYILHSPWGLHTVQGIIHKPGRVVIGRTVITPVNIGQGYFNVKKTRLDYSRKLLYLVPPTQLQLITDDS